MTEHEEGYHRRSRSGMGDRCGWLVSAAVVDELVSEGPGAAPVMEHDEAIIAGRGWGWRSRWVRS